MQESGDEGVLVFSISTLVKSMDDKMADMIAGALARLPFRVIWKYVAERQPATLGNNTLLASWIPQNDLLGKFKVNPSEVLRHCTILPIIIIPKSLLDWFKLLEQLPLTYRLLLLS